MNAMTDDDIVPFVQSLAWQIRVCHKAQAPVAAGILQAISDVADKSPVELPEVVRFGDFVPLRVLAALHALALDRRAPLLAMILPTAGGTGLVDQLGSSDHLRSAVCQALHADPGFIAEYLSRTPQTNEVGRARPLRLVLSEIAQRFPRLPVHLSEIGCSGGLLLNADRLERFDGEERLLLPMVASRTGYDMNPVDACSPAGRLLLSSYVWPDHIDRFRRLGAALELAQKFPPDVRRQDAIAALRDLRVQQGVVTLVWHSALMPYLSDAERDDLNAEFARIGALATPTAPFAIASWEVDSHAQARRLDFAATLTVWAGGSAQTEVLATGNSHATELRLGS